MIIAGRDKGKSGKVLEVRPTDNRAVVEGINLIKRHTKASMGDPQGGIKTREAAIHLSNVAIADPVDGKPTRIGFKLLEDGRKVRVAKRSGETING